MSQSAKRIKTEMKGTGGGRWMPREDAKKHANRGRREADKVEIVACQSCDGEGVVAVTNDDGDEEEATCGECFGTGKSTDFDDL